MERRKRTVGDRKLRLLSLADLDGRTVAARSAMRLRNAIANDLGGADNLTAAQLALASNAAVLGAALENIATKYLAGEGADLSLYATLANAQRRLLADLGLQRRAKDITPKLTEYMRGAA